MLDIKFENSFEKPVCLALGFFDSVHIGHRAILSKVKKYAEKNNCLSSVFTFDSAIVMPIRQDKRQVYTFDERIAIFETLGMDVVIHTAFDNEFMHIDAENFLNELFSRFCIKHIICGHDFGYGYRKCGNVESLSEYCHKQGVEATVVDRICADGERVSTTKIKNLLQSGNIEAANGFLGDSFNITGKVVHGRNEGHLYGIPTANTDLPADKFLPSFGVYGTYIYIDGKKYRAATNIGGQPTFGKSDTVVESMIDGKFGSLYGKTVKIEFVKRLRDICAFSSPDELAEQIHKDISWRNQC